MHTHFTPIDIEHIHRRISHNESSRVVLSLVSVFTVGVAVLLFYTLASKYHVF
ncbi:hypothetical protein BH09PAT2_BH09PAT2_10060 [soil metagenome]